MVSTSTFVALRRGSPFYRTTTKKKKPSPSTKARNLLRMEKFIEKKKASALNSNSKLSSAERNTLEFALKENESITSSTFKCDHCDYVNKTKKGLRCHIAQKYKEKQRHDLPSPIPQLDGRSENIHANVVSPTPVKEQETQTDVFIKVDEKGNLTEPFLDLLYDQPPLTVYHPVWGKGKYQKTDTYTENKIKRKAYCYEFENGELSDV